MGSISAGELKQILRDVPHDYEVLIDCHHKYDISKEEGEKGWIAFINAVHVDDERREVRLKN